MAVVFFPGKEQVMLSVTITRENSRGGEAGARGGIDLESTLHAVSHQGCSVLAKDVPVYWAHKKNIFEDGRCSVSLNQKKNILYMKSQNNLR